MKQDLHFPRVYVLLIKIWLVDGVTESDYYLLGSVEEAAEQEKEERVYSVLEMPGNDDDDYEDPDEGDLFRDYDKQKREREIERSTRADEDISVTS